jgi:hypothetical protein
LHIHIMYIHNPTVSILSFACVPCNALGYGQYLYLFKE